MNTAITIKEEELVEHIYFIRGTKVMFDFHLASLYETETRILKQQVRRNLNRFPDDFMFQLSRAEWQEVITICDNLSAYKFSPSAPFAFTEQGIAMLSSVLRSEKAVNVNIAIMRTFVHVRKILDTNRSLSLQLEQLEKKYDEKFRIVFEAIRNLIREESQPRKRIGFVK